MLQRTSDARFIICDLSGASGNGIKVNGSRVAQAALADGDRIEVGAVVLGFETRRRDGGLATCGGGRLKAI